MFWLNRQEVYMTNRVDLFHYAQQALKSGNIKYEIKNNNMGSTNRRTGRILGQFGENTSCEIMYYIYTSKKYSLQGTTQGRYLTGGVPPVRFSM